MGCMKEKCISKGIVAEMCPNKGSDKPNIRQCIIFQLSNLEPPYALEAFKNGFRDIEGCPFLKEVQGYIRRRQEQHFRE